MSRDSGHDDGFLSRWSRRKLTPEDSDLTADAASVTETTGDATAPAEPEPAQSRPLWQREDVDEDTRRQALRTLLRKPDFSASDGLDEYDENYTRFAGLGDIVTHEMKRMLSLAVQDEPSAGSTEPADQAADKTDDEDNQRA